jgi:hypothetical protein
MFFLVLNKHYGQSRHTYLSLAALERSRDLLKDCLQVPVRASRELYLISSTGSTVKDKIKSLALSQPFSERLSRGVFWFFLLFYILCKSVCIDFALRFCYLVLSLGHGGRLRGGGGEWKYLIS